VKPLTRLALKNVRLGWRVLSATNTLAYYGAAVKGFMCQTPGIRV